MTIPFTVATSPAQPAAIPSPKPAGVGLWRCVPRSKVHGQGRHRDLILEHLQLLPVRLERGLTVGERGLGGDEVGDGARLRQQFGEACDGGLLGCDPCAQVDRLIRDVDAVHG